LSWTAFGLILNGVVCFEMFLIVDAGSNRFWIYFYSWPNLVNLHLHVDWQEILLLKLLLGILALIWLLSTE